MQTINRKIVAAVIISLDQKILFGKKDPKIGAVFPDSWHIPGGGVEKGEDNITALKREIMEEVGIDISPFETKLLDDSGTATSLKKSEVGEELECQMQFNVYSVDIPRKSGEIKIKLEDELSEAKWIEKEELGSYKLTPPSVKLFTKLGLLK